MALEDRSPISTIICSLAYFRRSISQLGQHVLTVCSIYSSNVSSLLGNLTLPRVRNASYQTLTQIDFRLFCKLSNLLGMSREQERARSGRSYSHLRSATQWMVRCSSESSFCTGTKRGYYLLHVRCPEKVGTVYKPSHLDDVVLFSNTSPITHHPSHLLSPSTPTPLLYTPKPLPITSTRMSKLITVFGATGNQGGSVINHILADAQLSSEFKIRGITRDVNKPAAKALADKGVELATVSFSLIPLESPRDHIGS
jgi:hypothetical protein